MGHYEVKQSSLVASVDDTSGAIGLAGVVLKDIPTTAPGGGNYKLYADITTSGVASGPDTSVIGIRVDFIQKNTAGDDYSTLKSVFYRDDVSTGHSGVFGTTEWNALPHWQSAASSMNVKTDNLFSTGNTVSMNLTTGAPSGWITADGGDRRILVSLIYKGVGSAATVTARLHD
jgi:hypothetical protein